MSIYVFDIDGTISSAGKKVHPTICRRLSELTENNQVIFASARPVRDMLPMVSDELHSSVFIGCNGGMAWKNGQTVLSHVFDSDFVSHIINVMNNFGIPYVLDGEWNYSISKNGHPFHEYIRSLSNYEVCEEDIISSGVTKILILSEEYRDEIIVHAKDHDVSVHTHRNDGFYDFTPKGNNKHRTLSKLIGKEKYIAFGNDQNDFIMLRKAEISVFVGERENFKEATYYVSMDYIPTLINHIESNK
ncbi:HAD hydrolase family protein [Salmonella enterica]|nr:hydrolase [Salmonella enterica]EAW7866096.1 hydrolase [Salmonella enterica]EAY4734482.1 hydrolase [Salmonella enterica]ECJ4072475.1 hydrolase [Salmonella enterica subsp. enterica serovar Enteritidis]EJT9178536.1 HAD hydrolase family protein [Salmonella enterica]